MKNSFSISLGLTLILPILLISLLVAGCGKNKEEVLKQATETVNNFKDAVAKYESWVQTKADMDNPVVENQNEGFKAKIDTAMAHWNDNKDIYKSTLKAEDFSKLEADLKSLDGKKDVIDKMFHQKLQAAQNGGPIEDNIKENKNTDASNGAKKISS